VYYDVMLRVNNVKSRQQQSCFCNIIFLIFVSLLADSLAVCHGLQGSMNPTVGHKTQVAQLWQRDCAKLDTVSINVQHYSRNHAHN